MKKYYLFLICMATLFITNKSNSQSFSWAQSFGSAGFDEINPISTTIDGFKNVITTGNFTGSVDFNPGAGVTTLSSAAAVTDIYVQKLDSNGNFIWAISFIGTNYNNASAVKTDAAGNIYISGNFSSPVDFDPSLGTNIITPNGDRDAFIVKLNPAGIPQWVHHFGTPFFNASAQTLVIDNNNDLILSGYFQNTTDFDPSASVFNLSATGWADQFILKLNSSGGFVFAKSLSGTDYMDSKGISVDASNNICLTGTFYGTVDFDPGAGSFPLSSNSSDDVFILKLSSAGNFSWAQAIGNTGYESVAGIANDNLGNVYLAGSFSDSVDMNPSTGIAMRYSTGNSDLMAIKLSASGNFVWGKNFGGLYNEQVNSITIDNNNHLYFTGQFENTVDFDPSASTQNLVSNGYSDIFISSWDENGLFRMAKNIGGVSDDKGVNIVVNNSNNLFCTGVFKDTVDFDPSAGIANNIALSTFNPGDVFTLRWDLCSTSSSSLSAYDCNSVLINGTTYTSTGIYTQVLSSASGCDSLVTLNITIGNNNTTINHTQCTGWPYIFNGISYFAPGTYVQNHTNVAGCDSNFIIQLGYGSPSNYLIEDTACDVYFFGSQILFSSGSYSQVIPNASGCDSTIYLHLVVNNSSYNSVAVTSCGPYTFNGTVYGFSGTYFTIFPSANGCDSAVDLDLSVVITSSSTQTATSCKSYIYNGQTYTTSGVYLDTFTNIYGCDSVVTLNLTITSPNTNISQSGIILSVPSTPLATYQWINCSTGNTPIAGATATSYTPIVNGSYAVIVSVNGCADTSICKAVVGVGINDFQNENAITIYPNPIQDNISVDIKNGNDEIEIVVRNVVGQEMYRKKYLRINHLDISTSTWAAGSYLISIQQDGRNWVQKLVKQ